MPFVMATYMNHVRTANPQFRRFKSSSLDGLNNVLGAMPPGVLNAAQRQQVIETLGLIPHNKQQKYVTALNYARVNLNLNIPGIPYGYPVNLRTRLDFFEVAPAAWSNLPADSRNDGWLEHNFVVQWDSSNGNRPSLAAIWNREEVTFVHNPTGPPFNNMMAATPMNYTYGVTQSSTNDGSDNHYFMHPSLMLLVPLAAGIVTAHQWYQYSPDQGTTWLNIPNGQFVFDKGVRAGPAGGALVFVFSKRNWAPHNTRPFHFEVEYPIGPPPANWPANYAAVHGRGTGNQVPLNQHARIISMA